MDARCGMVVETKNLCGVLLLKYSLNTDAEAQQLATGEQTLLLPNSAGSKLGKHCSPSKRTACTSWV